MAMHAMVAAHSEVVHEKAVTRCWPLSMDDAMAVLIEYGAAAGMTEAETCAAIAAMPDAEAAE